MDAELEKVLRRVASDTASTAGSVCYGYVRMIVFGTVAALAVVCGSAVSCKYIEHRHRQPSCQENSK